MLLFFSTIEALMNSGVESAGELNYYNYHKEKSVMVPKVNKEVDVSVNVDTYTAAGALIPTIVDITVNADVSLSMLCLVWVKQGGLPFCCLQLIFSNAQGIHLVRKCYKKLRVINTTVVCINYNSLKRIKIFLWREVTSYTYHYADKSESTFQTQQFGKRKVIELRVDTGRLLPVANALLESEQYIISDALGHLLKMPMEQWIPYLARNQGFLTKAVMDNLALLHEKVSA